jgi:hypothetical protein
MVVSRGIWAVAVLVAGCSPVDGDRAERHDSTGAVELRVELARTGDTSLIGVADAPAPDTDQQPRYRLEGFDIVALDAAIDPDTRTLAWLEAGGTLRVAPLDRAPDGARTVANHVITGLAAAHGRLAYAVRVDGPETAPFVHDLRSRRTVPLADGPGPDEVLRFSPDGSEVLLLSGRTGVASLFAARVSEPSARQLTNVGLRPGPELRHARVTPAPASRRDIVWTGDRIRYRVAGRRVEVTR